MRKSEQLDTAASEHFQEVSMRLISFSVTVSLALLSPAAMAQQSPGTAGDKITHPPPLPGPPPISEPSSTAQSPPAASLPQRGEPAPIDYTKGYGPPGPSTPYSTGPLPKVDDGPGLDTAGPGGSTKAAKAVPCSTAARETDGTTTCIGISEGARARKHR